MSFAEDIKNSVSKKLMLKAMKNLKQMPEEQMLMYMAKISQDTAHKIIKQIEGGTKLDTIKKEWQYK